MFFKITAPETFKKKLEKHICWSSILLRLHESCLTPTTELKTLPQIIFLKSSKEKGCSKISKISQNLCKIAPFC